MESHRVSNLLGSPPGYRNSGEPTMLAPLLTHRCILLFDEIEKAHQNILTALMSAMDNGKIILSSPFETVNGEKIKEIDCRYSIFIFTSNLVLNLSERKTGFSMSDNPSPYLLSEEDRCKEALVKNGILPEIAGRITSFLLYQPLTESDIKQIIRLEVKQCADSFNLLVGKINDIIIDEIFCEIGSKFGVRAYKQLIERKLGKPLIDYLESDENWQLINISGSLDSIEIASYRELSGSDNMKKEAQDENI
jgi:ATP-dependent Clp protease ATP-binding subunit ClpA